MALSESKLKEYLKRLLLSRMRILCKSGFYGLLLMNVIFNMDESCETAATDGDRIFFGPKFLDDLNDDELDFIMMHELLHIVLDHVYRGTDFDNDTFNIACDIVVNSNILKENDMKLKSITLRKYGTSMHLTPNGDEGYKYTAEEVYKMLEKQSKKKDGGGPSGKKSGKNGNGNSVGNGAGGVVDDHSRWGKWQDGEVQELWVKRFEDACEAVSFEEACTGRGLLPLFAKRKLQELREPKVDWRKELVEFVQEEVCDYSFSPPDRRFAESPFFLPDFNDADSLVKDVLFMVDTSASMSDREVTDAFSEIKGAIDQFGGKLKGWIGYFDAGITAPVPFENADELIKPVGGGGTSFEIIFRYVEEYMYDKLPSSIVILTDGYAPFPDESKAMNIPVMWVINNKAVNPPWGRVIRI